LIAKVRFEIVGVWNQLHFGPQQRQDKFPVFHSTESSEDVLQSHEDYAQSLQALIPLFRPILEKEEQRAAWHARVMNLAKSTHDADFFKQKNVNKILQEEEKVREIGRKHLPQLEKEMEALIAQWEQANNAQFLYDGTRLLDMMRADRDTRQVGLRSAFAV